MQRRFALAAALAFTIVVTFAVVTLGTRARLFGSDATHEAAPVLADVPSTAPPPTAPPVAAAQPQVVTEYVYVDVPGGARQVAAPAVQAAVQSQAPAAPAPPTQSAPPSDVPPAARAAPTQAPPPTTAPSATPPSVPTRAPGQQSEIEFVGTVTAVQGNMVTFSHGGNSVVVQVSSGSLQAGDQAHVHANLVNGIYVASEIEMGN